MALKNSDVKDISRNSDVKDMCRKMAFLVESRCWLSSSATYM